jgi:hypothetical protein
VRTRSLEEKAMAMYLPPRSQQPELFAIITAPTQTPFFQAEQCNCRTASQTASFSLVCHRRRLRPRLSRFSALTKRRQTAAPSRTRSTSPHRAAPILIRLPTPTSSPAGSPKLEQAPVSPRRLAGETCADQTGHNSLEGSPTPMLQAAAQLHKTTSESAAHKPRERRDPSHELRWWGTGCSIRCCLSDPCFRSN